MLEQLARNPLIQKYIPSPFSHHTAPTEEDSPLETLEAMYIDAAGLMQDYEMPSKDEASSNLVELMELFSKTTKFFVNAWTWGYEDILKAIARNFSSKVTYILSITRNTDVYHRYMLTATSTISTIGSVIRFSLPSRPKRLERASTHANDGTGALRLKTAGKMWCTSTRLI